MLTTRLIFAHRRHSLLAARAHLEPNLEGCITIVEKVDPAFAAQARQRRLSDEDWQRFLTYTTWEQKRGRMFELIDFIKPRITAIDQLGRLWQSYPVRKAGQADWDWQAEINCFNELLSTSKEQIMFMTENLLLPRPSKKRGKAGSWARRHEWQQEERPVWPTLSGREERARRRSRRGGFPVVGDEGSKMFESELPFCIPPRLAPTPLSSYDEVVRSGRTHFALRAAPPHFPLRQ